MMQILIIGKNGQVAQSLARLSPYAIRSVGRDELDLSSSSSIHNFLKTYLRSLSYDKKNVIINAAAYTNVEKAEEEVNLAMSINASAQDILAEFCGKHGILYVSYSTDYIFDGLKNGPYDENDRPAPLNIYGKSKLAGEIAIAKPGVNYLILRTSWVFSATGNNFLRKIHELAQTKSEIRVVANQLGIPTSSDFIADMTYKLLNAFITQQKVRETINIAQKDIVSWFDFACKINELTGQKTIIQKITSNKVTTKALRPANSVLSTKKLQLITGIEPRSWLEDLRIAIDYMR